ncbi:hypothetical protein ACFUV2_09260 [Streptomyces pilosus]|uniref:hypothetical protein n=1 Tax=Streptomyces pilosus TaxID=28893 RepID=UPI003630BAE1
MAGDLPEHAATLARYGRALGVTFRLTEDIRVLTGVARPVDNAAGAALCDGTFAHPSWWRCDVAPGRLPSLISRGELAADEAVALVRGSEALDVTRALTQEQAGRAADALAAPPDGPARASLSVLVEYAVTRRVPQRPDVADNADAIFNDVAPESV